MGMQRVLSDQVRWLGWLAGGPSHCQHHRVARTLARRGARTVLACIVSASLARSLARVCAAGQRARVHRAPQPGPVAPDPPQQAHRVARVAGCAPFPLPCTLHLGLVVRGAQACRGGPCAVWRCARRYGVLPRGPGVAVQALGAVLGRRLPARLALPRGAPAGGVVQGRHGATRRPARTCVRDAAARVVVARRRCAPASSRGLRRRWTSWWTSACPTTDELWVGHRNRALPAHQSRRAT